MWMTRTFTVYWLYIPFFLLLLFNLFRLCLGLWGGGARVTADFFSSQFDNKYPSNFH